MSPFSVMGKSFCIKERRPR